MEKHHDKLGFASKSPSFTLEKPTSFITTPLTGKKEIPYMIYAPTMSEIPWRGTSGERNIAQNCYKATLAMLKIAYHHQHLFSDLFCPGLGTGIGSLTPESAAVEMKRAYDFFLHNCI